MNFPFPVFSAVRGLDRTVFYPFNTVVGAKAKWSQIKKYSTMAVDTNDLRCYASANYANHQKVHCTHGIAPNSGMAYWEIELQNITNNAPNNVVTIIGIESEPSTYNFGDYVSGGGVAQASGHGYATDGTGEYCVGFTGSNPYGLQNVIYGHAYNPFQGYTYWGWDTWRAVPLHTRTGAPTTLFPAVSNLYQTLAIANFGETPWRLPLSSIVGPREGDTYTSCLIHCDGPQGSNVFPDKSKSGYPIERSNCTIDTGNSKFGGGAAYFNAGPSYLYLQPGFWDPSWNNVSFGTGDFTIELWFNMVAGWVNTGQYIFDWRPGVQVSQPMCWYNQSSHCFDYYIDGSVAITGNQPITGGAWHHLALARAGGYTRMFYDGVQSGGTLTDGSNYPQVVNRGPMFGVSGYDAVSSPYAGWMDEIRISKGIARYTANFTPPTAPFA
jgi:hypothetical protein